MDNRRPVASRNRGWAQAAAAWLARHNIRPNQISLASIVFAALAGVAFWKLGDFGWISLMVAIVGMQLRLLSNLFDGMVAIEGGYRTPSGEVFNDAPDRASDLLILVPAGYAAGWPELGWLAGVFAVLTAYVRILGGSLGLKQRFSGPMAKQHRMAILSGACLIALIDRRALIVALVVITVGCVITVFSRLFQIVRELEQRG